LPQPCSLWSLFDAARHLEPIVERAAPTADPLYANLGELPRADYDEVA
jgi:hypothetical protein